MKTYLFVCGIILNIIVLCLIVYFIIDAIIVKRRNKKEAAKWTIRNTKYKEELIAAEQAWQKLAIKLDELYQGWEDADLITRSEMMMEASRCKLTIGRFYFTSIGESVSLNELAEKHGWVLPNPNAN